MTRREYIISNIVLLSVEIAAVLLMVFGILPRETVWVTTSLLAFYFIFTPLEHSLWLFIASIPVFLALPVTAGFDTMANWRFLLALLFIVFFWKRLPGLMRKIRTLICSREECLLIIFILICCLSLIAAGNRMVGLKKVLFLINAFLLYILVKNVVSGRKEQFLYILSALKTAAALVLTAGYIQLVIVFFVPLYPFWQSWARRVIPVFYGQNLADLLSRSNTWFSFYSYQPPTLRMFSIFPDSHSLAMFCILALPLFLAAVLFRSAKRQMFSSYFFLTFCLLAILFSGSRGAWASAVSVLIVYLIALPLARVAKIKLHKFKTTQLAMGSIILLLLLLPISSYVLLQASLLTDPGAAMNMDKLSLFARAKSITNLVETSAKTRLEIWRRTADSIIQHPVLGIGMGNYPLILRENIQAAKRGASAHNLYLDFAAEVGVFGLLVLLAFFFRTAYTAGQSAYRKLETDFPYFKVWAGFFLFAFLWVLSYSLFDVVLLNDKVLLFFAASLGLLYQT